MSDLRSQFIDFRLNLSHADQLNTELVVDAVDMAMDIRRDLALAMRGCLARFTRGSCLTRGSCRPPHALDAFGPSRALDASGTGRTRRARGTGNALWSSRRLTPCLRLSFRHGLSIASSFTNSSRPFIGNRGAPSCSSARNRYEESINFIEKRLPRGASHSMPNARHSTMKVAALRAETAVAGC